MKCSKNLLYLILVLFVVSCTESTEVVTVINPDGSCYREFTENVGHSFLLGDTTENSNPFPVKIDSTCKIAWKYGDKEYRTDYPITLEQYNVFADSLPSDTDNVTNEIKKSPNPFTVVLRTEYKSVEEMNKNFRYKPSFEWSSMKVNYSLEKEFKWFYTYYTYKETYPRIKTGFNIPIEEYMSVDEAKFWFTGQPDLLKGMNGIEIREYIGSLEDKYNHWFAKNSWDNQYKILLENYDKIKSKPVTIERLEILRDTIFKAKVKNFEDIEMENALNEYFKTKVFSELWNNADGVMKKFEKDFSEQTTTGYFTKSFNYNLKLPGNITVPNNSVIKGDTLTWRLTAYRMVHDDYVIEAQSRRANIWTFVLTGIVLIIAIGSFVYKPKRRIK